MTGPLSLRDRILDFKFTQKVFTRLGIDVRQYRLLLDLFALLSSRLEFFGTTVSSKSIASAVTPLSIFLCLPVLARPKPQDYLLFLLPVTMFFLLWILLEDISHSLLNADEASVMAHQPIRGSTYVAAKLTHLLSVIGVFVLSISAIPALAGLYMREARWFYPLTHILAAYLAGLFIAFLVCSIYGYLFRYVPSSSIKAASLWLQVLVASAPWLVNLLRGSWVLRLMSSPWLPFRWFAAVGVLGSSSNGRFPVWQAGTAMFVTCCLVILGIRGLAMDYLIRASMVLQGGPPIAPRPARGSGLRNSIQGLTGAQSGCAAFAFTSVMMRRDWHFLRQALPMMIVYLVISVGLAVQGIKTSPFVSGSFSVRSFPPMLFFPSLLGMVCLAPCWMLHFTADARGAWIFGILPLDRLRPFVRGVFLSLWVPIVGVIHICLLFPCILSWGPVHGLIFVLFSSGLTTFFLTLAFLLVDGLPFSESFKPGQGEDARMAMIFGMILAVIIGGIQWLVFHSVLLVVAEATILLVLAGLVAHAGFTKLEREMRAQLNQLQLGPKHLFKEVEARF